MRIFLTFASEQRDIAESILLSLRSRGHTVFFSHDDLPSGESFDARIEKAVGSSDLLVFLVSPESVAKGRFTLTELSFARDKWPSPKGRVLPVLVAPTAMASLPQYLKAVTLLEPEGNVAAETASAVDKLFDRSRAISILTFAGLGVVTGVLSFLSYKYAPKLLTLSFFRPSGMYGPDAMTVVPGIVFGLLVAACVYRSGARDKFLLFVALLFTTIAWTAAYDTTVLVHLQLGEFRKTTQQAVIAQPVADEPASSAKSDDKSDPKPNSQEETSETSPPSSDAELIPVLAGLSGIAGGLVGGLVTIFGVAIAAPAFRRFESWLIALATATVLGALLEAARLGETVGFIILFAVWQAAVITTIARGVFLVEKDHAR